MPQTVKLAEYLFNRLTQLGIGAIHGVPGDYNLDLLDYVEPSMLLWVGNANELNAGYAADGYARTKGMGALITTYGVGELSAINAIACAYTERAAVVHIVGTPPRSSQESRAMIHHTLGDGDYRHFAQMAAHVTVAQANLIDARTACEQIDMTLRQCLLHNRPVYIEVPVDMVAVEIPAARLATRIILDDVLPDPNLELTLSKILDKIYAAKQPVILVDGETRGLGLADVVQQIVTSTGWPTFTSIFGKSVIDMTLPNVYGIYRGRCAHPDIRNFIETADLVLCFGPHFSSTNSYNWTSVPHHQKTIRFTYEGICIGNEDISRVSSVKHAVKTLFASLKISQTKRYPANLNFPRDELLSFSAVESDEVIKQDKIWRVLAQLFRPGDIVMGETGTAGYGVREMPLPKSTQLFTPVTWLSIGYMLPASQGAALAQKELIQLNKYYGLKNGRTILFIGDGSFQMTVQELATIIRLNLNVMVFLINNSGYTIERCIHGMNQKYNDVSSLRYLEAPSFFGAPKNSYTAAARTYGELEAILNDSNFVDGDGLRMVEIHMDRMDAPAGPLLELMEAQRIDCK